MEAKRTTTSLNEHLRQMRELRDSSGVRAVLIYLNELTEHRYTALFRFEDEQLHSVHFYDSERPDDEWCADIPISASYCVFVRNSGQTFVTLNSVVDERVESHPKRLEIRSYCGVPLVDETGRPFGSVCHFDPRPLPISDQNVALMEELATLLTEKGKKA